jgi:hypothetical protein
MFKIKGFLVSPHLQRTCPGSISIVAISTRSMDGGDSGLNTHLRSLIMASTNFEMIPYKAIRIIPVVE